MSTKPPGQFPNSCHRVQLLAVRLQEIQCEAMGVVFPPFFMETSMMVSGVVCNDDHAFSGNPAGLGQMIEKNNKVSPLNFPFSRRKTNLPPRSRTHVPCAKQPEFPVIPHPFFLPTNPRPVLLSRQHPHSGMPGLCPVLGTKGHGFASDSWCCNYDAVDKVLRRKGATVAVLNCFRDADKTTDLTFFSTVSSPLSRKKKSSPLSLYRKERYYKK